MVLVEREGEVSGQLRNLETDEESRTYERHGSIDTTILVEPIVLRPDLSDIARHVQFENHPEYRAGNEVELTLIAVAVLP